VLERVKLLRDAEITSFQLRPNEEAAKEKQVSQVTDEWLEQWRLRGEDLRSSGKRRVARLKAAASKLDMSAFGEAKEHKAATIDGAGGKLVEGDIIKMENAWIVSPDGRLLVKDLNLEVPHGVNVMITGPNGCGKSSMFRVIGELWPPYKGVIYKPPKEDIVFVPQKPYLVMGTLRDQIIYPHSRTEMDSLGVTDDDLTRLLDIVDPARSIVNECKYDQERNWSIALSGGQKQRVAMARVFYHRPRYAILDECTSAVSNEVEGKIYTTCKKLGITLFTVSHRPNLQQYHEYQLRLDGHGNWRYLTREEVDKNPVRQ